LDNIKANQLQNFNQKARKMKPKSQWGTHSQVADTGLLPRFQTPASVPGNAGLFPVFRAFDFQWFGVKLGEWMRPTTCAGTGGSGLAQGTF